MKSSADMKSPSRKSSTKKSTYDPNYQLNTATTTTPTAAIKNNKTNERRSIYSFDFKDTQKIDPKTSNEMAKKSSIVISDYEYKKHIVNATLQSKLNNMKKQQQIHKRSVGFGSSITTSGAGTGHMTHLKKYEKDTKDFYSPGFHPSANNNNHNNNNNDSNDINNNISISNNIVI
jgi:hypothetical protein